MDYYILLKIATILVISYFAAVGVFTVISNWQKRNQVEIIVTLENQEQHTPGRDLLGVRVSSKLNGVTNTNMLATAIYVEDNIKDSLKKMDQAAIDKIINNFIS